MTSSIAEITAKDPLLSMMREMLTTQDALNCRFVGNDWRSAAADREKVDYGCAILEEAMELQASDPSWKWWKSNHPAPDIKNMKLELVDILHFAMSEAMVCQYMDTLDLGDEDVDNEADMESVAHRMAEGYSIAFGFQDTDSGYLPKLNLPPLLAMENYDALATRSALHALVASVLQGSNSLGLDESEGSQDDAPLSDKFLSMSCLNWTAFWSVAKNIGSSLAEVYSIYVGKAVLNEFRIANGDKTGVYHRTWLDGKEDNEVLMDYYANFFQEGGAFPTSGQTTAWLTLAYQEYLEKTSKL